MGNGLDSVGSMPESTDPHPPYHPEPVPNFTSAVSAAVAALSDLVRFPFATDAARQALAALSQIGPVVGHLTSAGEVGTERNLARNVDMTGGPIAIGVDHGRDSLNDGSLVISSHEASPGFRNNVSNREQHTAWCEICRVGCNSFQILEQHKIGKRHKKNLQRIEELKRVVCVNTQEAGTSGVGAVVQGEAASKIPINIDYDPKIGNDRIADRKGSSCKKRKSKENETIAKRAKKVVTPIVCSVCNIKCDTHEVFYKHLSGKKHISKVKHSQLHQPKNSEIGLRAVYLNHPMSQVPPSQDNEYRFLISEGSYLPPMSRAYTSLSSHIHYQVNTS